MVDLTKRPAWFKPNPQPLEMTIEDMVIASEQRTPRSCGTCDACCTVMGVAEISKPHQERCCYLNETPGKSCEIYMVRPVTCRVWFCGWVLGVMSDNHRPDKVGVVVNPGMSEGYDEGVPFQKIGFTARIDPRNPTRWKALDIQDELRKLSLNRTAVAVGLGSEVLAVFFDGELFELTPDQRQATGLMTAGAIQIAPGVVITHDPQKLW